jgi:RNA polymerase sigma factor (sigma-70 family)
MVERALGPPGFERSTQACAEAPFAAGTPAERAKRIVEHLGLVTAVARSLSGRGVSRADLIQEGCIALIRALDGFAHRGGPMTPNYVVRKSRERMLRAIRRRRAASERHVPLSPAREASLGTGDPFAALSSVELEDAVRHLLDLLSPFDRKVLEFRFGFHGRPRCTIEEAARVLEVRPERVGRSEDRILLLLRARARRLRPLLRHR